MAVGSSSPTLERDRERGGGGERESKREREKEIKIYLDIDFSKILTPYAQSTSKDEQSEMRANTNVAIW